VHDTRRLIADPLIRAGGVVTLVVIVWFVIQYVGPVGPRFTGWLPVPVATVLAAWACRTVAAGLDAEPAARRFWRHVTLTMVVVTGAALSNACDMLFDLGAEPGRASWLTNALFAFGIVILTWALLRLPIRRTRTDRLQLGLDIGIVMVAGALIAWYLGIRGKESLAQATGSSFAIVMVVLAAFAGLVAIVKVTLTGSGVLDRSTLWALGATLAVGTIGGSLAPLMEHRTDLANSQIVVPLASYGVLIAALLQLHATRRLAPVRANRRPFSFLPYVAIGLTDALVIVAVSDRATELRLLVAGSVVLTALVVVRQLLSFYDNASLLAKVDVSLLELRRHERRFRSLVQNSTDVIVINDAAGQITYASPALTRVLGARPGGWDGTSVFHHVHPDDVAEVRRQADTLTESGGTATFQVRLRHADGSWRWLQSVSTNLLHDPSVRGIVNNARDVTETRRFSDQLAYQATHDELTGLANRTLFYEQTMAAVAGAATGPDRGRDASSEPAHSLDRRPVIALVDLDDFKSINDRLGHAVGDALLVAVSQRLRTCLRPSDLVARLGGDEFAVLLTDGGGPAAAEAIMDALTAPVQAAGYELLVQASIGLALYLGEGDANDLLRRADVAMYAAKELGKSRWVQYRPELDAEAVEHAQLAAELSQALDRGELRLVYQPIVSLPDGTLRGVEALLRWEHPVRGTVSPAQFVPVAERTGLIVPIGAWVLREACRQSAQWQRTHGSRAPLKISVNVSARQLLEPAYVGTVAETIATAGIDPESVTLEITETAVFGGGRALDAVWGLAALGVKVALDDFGTGHSSLGLLRTCPVDVLKVDKSFVDGVTGTLEDQAIVTSISEIARALRLEAIAEGVETAAQAKRLYELGYTLAQGFHFSRPVPPAEIDRWCASAVPVNAAA
jgi:diguanylate cyclase (GGDEF)-like protein/PAS domain S-box-containing protein